MMAEIGKMTTLSWFDSATYRLVLIPAVKRGLLEHAQKFTWMSSRPVWGKGRIDPQNPFKFTTLAQPIDQTIGNSDMPPLWNMKARRNMALHWDGMNTVYPRGAAQFRARQWRDDEVARRGRHRSSGRLVRRGAAAEVPVPDRSGARASRAARSLRRRVRRATLPAARAPAR